MKAFATFIESDAFFPVLCTLMGILVIVFIYILVSGMKKEEKRRQSIEDNVDEQAEIKVVKEEFTNVEIPISKKNDIKEETPTDEIKLVIEKEDELKDIELIPKFKKEDDVAFASQPNGDETIKDDLVFPEPVEYTGEKTEMFEFPDFSDVPGTDEAKEQNTIKELDEASKNVQDEVLEAANKYIASVMGK